MTYKEQILQVFPHWTAYAVATRADKFAKADARFAVNWRDQLPCVVDCPEYLGMSRIDATLAKIPYGSIAEYAWELQDLPDFDKVAAVIQRLGGKLNYVKPNYTEDLITPKPVAGFVWNLVRSHHIRYYSHLVGLTVQTPLRKNSFSQDLREFLKSKGIEIKTKDFMVIFQPYDIQSYVEKYRRDGVIVFKKYSRNQAEAIEKYVQAQFPNAHLQFDRDLGVVLR